MSSSAISNDEVSKVLEEIAEYLEYQDANEYRVSAYRRAADSIQTLDESVAEIVDSDERSLKNIPNIGTSLAGTITDYLHKSRSSQLERLKGEVDPVELIAGVPGVGEELAERIVLAYDIASLEELEMAAHDGRLEKNQGIGKNRLQGIRDSLNSMLSRSSQRRARKLQRSAAGEEVTEPSEPPVSILLDVDREYRKKAEKDQLKKLHQSDLIRMGKNGFPFCIQNEKSGISQCFFQIQNEHTI
mgnify:CR=1 FL=1